MGLAPRLLPRVLPGDGPSSVPPSSESFSASVSLHTVRWWILKPSSSSPVSFPWWWRGLLCWVFALEPNAGNRPGGEVRADASRSRCRPNTWFWISAMLRNCTEKVKVPEDISAVLNVCRWMSLEPLEKGLSSLERPSGPGWDT